MKQQLTEQNRDLYQKTFNIKATVKKKATLYSKQSIDTAPLNAGNSQNLIRQKSHIKQHLQASFNLHHYDY